MSVCVCVCVCVCVTYCYVKEHPLEGEHFLAAICGHGDAILNTLAQQLFVSLRGEDRR